MKYNYFLNPDKTSSSYCLKNNIFRITMMLFIFINSPFITIAQVPFACDGKFYYMVEGAGASVKLVSVSNYTAGSPTSQYECTLPGSTTNSFNALGANPLDGFLYFIEKKTNGNTQLRRLDANCSTTAKCPVDMLPFCNAGCFDHLGRFWIIDNDVLSGWDLNTCNRVKGPYNLPAGKAGNDLVYNTQDCFFYTGTIKIDLNGNDFPTGNPGISGPGMAMGIDGKAYSIGGGNATSSVLTRYDLPSTTGTIVGNVSPGTVGGTDAASFPCTSVNADFTASVSPGCAPPISASFTDNSGGLVTTWLWDFGDGTTSPLQSPSHTYLTSGTYTVQLTVAASSSCIAIPNSIKSIIITIPTALSFSTSSKTDVSCFGGNNGTATVTISGGTSPYTYTWSPSGATGATASNLSAGTYTLTVTDNVGCTTATTAVIAEPSAVTLTPLGSTLSCVGGADGTVSITASGGTNPFIYAWAPSGETGTIISNLSAGTYSVTVSDSNGCTKSTTATVTSPNPIVLTPSSTDASCGGSNGSATISVSGGSSPYGYSWSPGNATTANISNISGGSYIVTITDNKSCTQTTSVVVNNSGAATLTVDSTAVTCNGGSNGTATVSVSGGTNPYTYLWNSIPAQTTTTATGLPAGVYTIIVTDNVGCISSLPVTIIEPAAIIVAAAKTDVSCFGGNNGTATITVTGGSGIYTYVWSSGSSGTTSSNLSAGTYTITATDNAGCTGLTTVTISQPSTLTLTTSSSNVSCFGGDNGATTISVSGGTTPYTYSWSPTGATSSGISNLTAGNYNVTVSDNNGCTKTVTTVITQPTIIGLTTSKNDLSCFGDNTGTASVTASGGTSPYTYAWSPLGSTTSNISNLAPNNYTVTVSDNNGCTQTTSITITEPPVITLATPLTTTNVSCFGGNNGSASISVSGGTNPYTYTWSPLGGTGVSASNLTAGTYTVVITDNNGCSDMATAVITQPIDISLTTSGSNVSCNGGNDGAAIVSASGGTGTYTYLWSPSGETTTTLSNLTTGTYIITVTDNNGCTKISSITITTSGTVNADFTPDPIIGTVPLTVNFTNNSIGGISYNWFFGDGTTDTVFNPSHIYNKIGDYTITLIVTGSGGCIDSITHIIKVVEKTVVCVPNVFTPNGDGVNEVFDICGQGMVVIKGTIYNRWGMVLYEWDTPKGGWDGRTTSGEEVPDGVYYYLIYAKGTDGQDYNLKGFIQLLKAH